MGTNTVNKSVSRLAASSVDKPVSRELSAANQAVVISDHFLGLGLEQGGRTETLLCFFPEEELKVTK